MTDDAKKTPPGDRIAKVLARAGVASRREAEKIVEAGRVSVNGKVVLTPALNVISKDRILVDGKPLAAAEPPRMWLYHKPAGLVTTERDEQGRDTVFDALPKDMPRVVSVGRLDLNSEGLLVLTNDGELKRKMELPATGWLRRYRVRIKGSLSETKLDILRKGVVVEGIRYAPMDVTFDRQQGANAWLTVGLREGKNRDHREPPYPDQLWPLPIGPTETRRCRRGQTAGRQRSDGPTRTPQTPTNSQRNHQRETAKGEKPA